MEKLKHRLLTIIFLFTTLFFFANGQEVKALSCAEKGSLQEELDGYTGAVYGEIKKIKVDLKQEGITGTKEKVR
nr:hypothetical protein [Paenibacillus xylanexedens]